jgi:hypothetical protein
VPSRAPSVTQAHDPLSRLVAPGLTAHVLEWQYCDRWLVRQCGTRLGIIERRRQAKLARSSSKRACTVFPKTCSRGRPGGGSGIAHECVCNNGDRFLLSLLVCFTTEKTGDLPTGRLLHIAHLLTANGQHRVERHETDFATGREHLDDRQHRVCRSDIKTTAGQTFSASTLFSASDPFEDAIAQYDFWDTGSGGGRFMLNGQALGTNQDNYVSAGQLAQASYVSGSGTDTLWVRVSEGGQWSVWSQSFTVSDPTTIGAGETVELNSAYSGHLAFAADTGTLKLDNSATFAGTVAGMTGHDTIDFTDIDPTKAQAASYSGDTSGGTQRDRRDAHGEHRTARQLSRVRLRCIQ